jgi:hypothetical protein
MKRVGHGVSYSTWNPATAQWDYWTAMGGPNLRGGVIAPAPRLRNGRLGIAPEDAARPLPMTAVKVGSGPIARGLVAHRGMGAMGAFDVDPMLLAIYATAAYFAYRWWKRRA